MATKKPDPQPEPQPQAESVPPPQGGQGVTAEPQATINPDQPWFQQMPSKINYEVPGSPVPAGSVADGGEDAVEAAEAAEPNPGGQQADTEESVEEKPEA